MSEQAGTTHGLAFLSPYPFYLLLVFDLLSSTSTSTSTSTTTTTTTTISPKMGFEVPNFVFNAIMLLGLLSAVWTGLQIWGAWRPNSKLSKIINLPRAFAVGSRELKAIEDIARSVRHMERMMEGNQPPALPAGPAGPPGPPGPPGPVGPAGPAGELVLASNILQNSARRRNAHT